MDQPMIDSYRGLLELCFQRPLGSSEFYVVLGVSVAAALIIARLLVGLFGSARGFVACAVALALTVGLGAVAYTVTEVRLLPLFEWRWESYLPWVAFALFALLSAVVFGKRLLDLGGLTTVCLLLLAAAAACGGKYAAHVVLDLMESGERQVERRDQRLKEGLDQAN